MTNSDVITHEYFITILSTFHTVVNCTTPPIVNNADMEYLCTTFGCLAMYTCAEGYSTNDVPYAICGSDMNWSGADEITCNGMIVF